MILPMRGTARREFFNTLSGTIVIGCGLAGGLIGFSCFGFVGGLVGLGAGITAGGSFAEKRWFYRR
jgi:hypothetical protein